MANYVQITKSLPIIFCKNSKSYHKLQNEETLIFEISNGITSRFSNRFSILHPFLMKFRHY